MTGKSPAWEAAKAARAARRAENPTVQARRADAERRARQAAAQAAQKRDSEALMAAVDKMIGDSAERLGLA